MAILPTLITLGNGVCGVVAVFKIGMALAAQSPDRAELYFQQAAWLILGGMVFDALDGFAARVTRTASPFGAQLDSLCDLLTFGLAPAFLVFGTTRSLVDPDSPWSRPVQAVCALYAMCALIRLARFTVETSPEETSHREFHGLPSPAAAGVIASAVLPVRPLMDVAPEWVVPAINSALPGLTLAMGILMVSRLRYAHLVNRLLRGRRPFVTLIEVALTITLIVILREFAFFIAFFLYALTGPILWIRRRLPRRAPQTDVTSPPVTERKDSLF